MALSKQLTDIEARGTGGRIPANSSQADPCVDGNHVVSDRVPGVHARVEAGTSGTVDFSDPDRFSYIEQGFRET